MVSNTYIIHTMIRVKAVHYPSKRGRDGHNFCPSPEHPWPIRGREHPTPAPSPLHLPHPSRHQKPSHLPLQPQRPLPQPGISPSILSNKGMVTLLFCIHSEHKGQEHAHTHVFTLYCTHTPLSFIILHIPAKARAIYFLAQFHLHWGANPQQKNNTSDKH